VRLGTADDGHDPLARRVAQLSEREDLEHRVIVDLPDDARVGRTGNKGLGSEMVGTALAVGIIVSAILLCLMLGAPSFLVQVP